MRGIAWNDPDIGIEWSICNPILSDKDKRNPPLSNISQNDLPKYKEVKQEIIFADMCYHR